MTAFSGLFGSLMIDHCFMVGVKCNGFVQNDASVWHHVIVRCYMVHYSDLAGVNWAGMRNVLMKMERGAHVGCIRGCEQ